MEEAEVKLKYPDAVCAWNPDGWHEIIVKSVHTLNEGTTSDKAWVNAYKVIQSEQQEKISWGNF